MDISLIWAMIIALGVLIYVVLDGFDLGIGILFPFIQDQQERDVMMNTVAPVWDGNETWMVLGGAGLFAAFPIVYATVLSAFISDYAMVIALILRGISFQVSLNLMNPTLVLAYSRKTWTWCIRKNHCIWTTQKRWKRIHRNCA
jgi:cytochrome d oxidase subunit CydB